MAKILVADDNSNIQKMVGLALKDQGIDVVAVGNGEAAVRKISDIRPDLVLADVFMPVRNGYEVCRYVKEDSALSHIPVILLVGAFDPLDEQEAQRVGADGVLKKPFVPPDPLISMVKSALARAGVVIGVQPAAENAPEPGKRTAAGILTPAASKLAATSDKLPEVPAEPAELEDFPSLTRSVENVKIAAGQEPLAFGSLLETEDDAQFLPAKPPTEIGNVKNWDGPSVEDEEPQDVAEDEPSQSTWRPNTALEEPSDDLAAPPSRVSDWRDEAFHGSSPSKSHGGSRWTPLTVSEPSFAEAAESPSVAVSTLEPKLTESPAPFTGDAWAAAMAAGLEEKLATPGSEAAPIAESVGKPEPAVKTEPPATPAESQSANSWFSVSSSPWETEAKKASLLAATWDAPASAAPEIIPQRPAAATIPEGTEVRTLEPSVIEQETTETTVTVQDTVISAAVQPEPVPAVSAYEQLPEGPPNETPDFVAHQNELAEGVVETIYSPEPSPNETQELEPYVGAATQEPANTWTAPTPELATPEPEVGAEPPASPKAASEPERATEFSPLESAAFEPAAQMEPVTPTIDQVEHAPLEPQAPALEHAALESQPLPSISVHGPQMDELVARVLEKMSPDVLHRVTCEILKPVIEALIQDELQNKKP